MNILNNNDLLTAIEQAHCQNQQGMYFSGKKVIKGALLLYSKIINDCFWNYATQINVTQLEQKN